MTKRSEDISGFLSDHALGILARAMPAFSDEVLAQDIGRSKAD